MNLKILRDTRVGGVVFAAGSIVELADNDAQLLLGMGKATADFDVPKPKKKAKKKDN